MMCGMKLLIPFQTLTVALCFRPTLYDECNHLPILGLKLNHDSE